MSTKARVFLSKTCPDCAVVQAKLDFEAVMDDSFRGSADQELLVFSALSNEATRELLDAFGLRDYKTPVLITHEGNIIDRANAIVQYLRMNGMAK